MDKNKEQSGEKQCLQVELIFKKKKTSLKCKVMNNFELLMEKKCFNIYQFSTT